MKLRKINTIIYCMTETILQSFTLAFNKNVSFLLTMQRYEINLIYPNIFKVLTFI